MKQKIEIEVDVPEGYEPTGEVSIGKPIHICSGGELVQITIEDVILPLKKVEPKQPQFKAFEIDWCECSEPFIIPVSPGVVWDCEIGVKIDNYRIFGFGDEKDIEGETYKRVPCDHHGNYKYAYGRLEEDHA